MLANRRARSTTRPHRLQQREATRDRLYETALAEFRRVGFVAAQIDAIVQHAGVARGTFYFHFPTKEDVLFEYARREIDKLGAGIDPAAVRTASIEQVLDGLLEAIVAENSPADDPALIHDVIAAVIRAGELRDWMSEPAFVALTEGFVGAAVRGEVRADIPPSELALILMSAVFGTMLTYIARGPEALRQGLRRALDVFLRGARP